jgi:NADP-dependent 3-hydroxy acid dehydrogenase YdfG
MGSIKVAVIAGYGAGISRAVAQQFGKGGFSLALLARTQSRLDAAVAGAVGSMKVALNSEAQHRPAQREAASPSTGVVAPAAAI